MSSDLDALLISLYVLVDDPHTGPPSAAPCRRKTPPFHAAQYFAPHSPKDPLRAASAAGQDVAATRRDAYAPRRNGPLRPASDSRQKGQSGVRGTRSPGRLLPDSCSQDAQTPPSFRFVAGPGASSGLPLRSMADAEQHLRRRIRRPRWPLVRGWGCSAAAVASRRRVGLSSAAGSRKGSYVEPPIMVVDTS